MGALLSINLGTPVCGTDFNSGNGFFCRCPHASALGTNALVESTESCYISLLESNDVALYCAIGGIGMIAVAFVLLLFARKRIRLWFKIEVALVVFASIVDTATDLNYYLTENFYNEALFYATTATLVCALLLLPSSWLLSTYGGGIPAYFSAEENRNERFSTIVKLGCSIGLWTVWGVVGITLYHLKLLALRGVHEEYASRFPEDTKAKKENKTDREVDKYLVVESFNTTRLVEVVTESFPMIILQVWNALLVGETSLGFLLSVTASVLNVISYLYAYLYRISPCSHLDDEAPVGFCFKPDRVDL